MTIYHYIILLIILTPFALIGAAIYWFVVKPRRKAQAEYDAEQAARGPGAGEQSSRPG